MSAAERAEPCLRAARQDFVLLAVSPSLREGRLLKVLKSHKRALSRRGDYGPSVRASGIPRSPLHLIPTCRPKSTARRVLAGSAPNMDRDDAPSQAQVNPWDIEDDAAEDPEEIRVVFAALDSFA